MKNRDVLLYLGRSGGGPSFTYSLFHESTEHDLLICSTKNELVSLYQADFGGNLLCFDFPHSFSAVGKIYQIFRCIYTCARSARRVTISHYTPYLFLFFFLFPFCEIRYYMHDVVSHKRSLSEFCNNFFASLFCKKVFVLSEQQKNLFGFPFKNNVSVVPHPIYHHYFSPNFRGCATPAVSKPFLIFGRLESYKGLELINFLDECFEKNVVNIIGRGHGIKSCVSKSYTLENRYVCDSEVPDLLSKCDFVLLPYTSATQSGLIPLAATFKKTIVCFDLPVLVDQCINFGVRFHPVKSGDYLAFVSKLKDLANET